MQKTGLRKVAASTGGETRFSGVGGMPTSGPTRVGERVPWGAHFKMGVNVRDAMKRSRALGTRKVDFCAEVC